MICTSKEFISLPSSLFRWLHRREVKWPFFFQKIHEGIFTPIKHESDQISVANEEETTFDSKEVTPDESDDKEIEESVNEDEETDDEDDETNGKKNFWSVPGGIDFFDETEEEADETSKNNGNKEFGNDYLNDDIEDIGDATDEDSKELPTGTFEQLNIR